jgi:hypothetical protein
LIDDPQLMGSSPGEPALVRVDALVDQHVDIGPETGWRASGSYTEIAFVDDNPATGIWAMFSTRRLVTRTSVAIFARLTLKSVRFCQAVQFGATPSSPLDG